MTAVTTPPKSWRNLNWGQLFAPVDIAFLVAFRIVFGLLLLIEMSRFLSNDWIPNYYLNPVFHFTYSGFGWVKLWPGNGIGLHVVVMIVLLICIILGLGYRFVMPLFCIGFSYLFLIDKTTYRNHFYLIILISFLMSFMPASQAFSLDARLRPQKSGQTVPLWTLWLLRAQFTIVYIFGGIAKLNADWLRGEPLRMWLAQETDFPLIGKLFTQHWMPYFFSYGGLFFDLLIVPLLMWRRTRPVAVLLAIFFHLTNARLFHIGIFPWFMMAAVPLFFEPDWIRQVLRKITDRTSSPQHFRAPAPARPVRWHKLHPNRQVGLMLIGLYLLLQILLPLRHLAYPGNASWTGEGDRFAWRMMLSDRRGQTDFFLVDEQTGEVVSQIDASFNLSPAQLAVMAQYPDMILQYTHFLAQEMAKQGYAGLAIHVDAVMSLNGRSPQPLIDPTVNLVAQTSSLQPADWIIPLYQPLPTPTP
jgi:hypothetical protein